MFWDYIPNYDDNQSTPDTPVTFQEYPAEKHEYSGDPEPGHIETTACRLASVR